MKVDDQVRNRGLWKKWTGRIVAVKGKACLVEIDNRNPAGKQQVWYLEHEIKTLRAG